MRAEELLRQGKLLETRAELQEQVRNNPDNAAYRVFLFQLLAVLGEWDRALTQLNVAGDLDASTLAMVHMYREALQCEALRGEIFDGRRAPLVFGEPEPWVALLVEALRLSAEGKYEECRTLREQALEAAPVTPGTIDGNAFEWIADSDSRLGPVLEAIVSGRYYWVPFNRIREIHIEEPADLRDFVWMPVHFTWDNGGDMVGLIPTRYPGSQDSDDDDIRLARKTEWIEKSGDLFLGMGQRMLTTDADDYPLMGARRITLSTSAAPEEFAAPQATAERSHA